MPDVVHQLLTKSRLAKAPANTVSTMQIVGSVLCLGVSLFLMILWVRSYTWRDSEGLRLYAERVIRIYSIRGQVAFETHTFAEDQENFVRATRLSRIDAVLSEYGLGPMERKPARFGWETTAAGRTFVYVPHWFLILLTTALASITWIRWKWQFSLRTLLIATTLFAVVLGMAVYFGR